MQDYKSVITIEPGKRGGKPCIRGMRITVQDILGWLASGMTIQEIISDYDELKESDIYAALSLPLTVRIRFIRLRYEAFV